MSINFEPRWTLIAIFVLAVGHNAQAQCPAIDFENLVDSTVVTTQYDGVAFSAPGGACTGDAIIRDMTAFGGTASGINALATRAGTGCEFSPEHLRMIFERPQASVSFTLGPFCGDYSIDAYDAPVGGSLVSSQTVAISGCTSLHGVHRIVHVTSPAGDIRRIEIDGGDGASEGIDDLLFNVDTTQPIVEIDEPLARQCVCDSVLITGSVDDPDGEYGCDELQYREQDASTWTTASGVCGPFTGVLYNWDNSMLPGGYYFLRIVGNNACGLSNSDDTLVFVDKDPPTLNIRRPTPMQVVSGVVCFDGSIHESRGTRNGCLDRYTIEYGVAGEFQPVDPGQPVYLVPVVNDPLAQWDTRAGIADGSYPVRARATDICGNPAEQIVEIIVDNTSPTAEITSPMSCGYVEGLVEVVGTANDANLRDWILDYSGDGEHAWTTIATGSSSVVDDVLGLWDTSGIPNCAYVLRLRVWDQSVRDCNSALSNRTDYLVSVNVGSCVGFDADEDGDVDLIDYGAFQDEFTGPNP
jgi:hypothetical protein